MDETQAVLLDQVTSNLISLAFVLGTVFLLAKLAKAQPALKTFVLILLPIPFWIASIFLPWLNAIIPVYTYLLMLLLLLDGFFLSVAPHQIELARVFSRKISIGQRHWVALTIINNSRFQVSGQAQDSVPLDLRKNISAKEPNLSITVPPYSHQALSYEILPDRRGIFQFEKIYFRYGSRLGLLWLNVLGGRPDQIKVTPDLRRIRRLRILVSRAQNAGELQKRSLGLEGSQFMGLRHYFPGDDFKKMAWQATAKLDIPVLRSFTHDVEQPIVILMDAGKKMNLSISHESGLGLQKYDWALNTALAFLSVAIDRRDCVGLGVFSNRVLAHIPLGSGKSHLSRILETLSETEVQAVESDYESMMLYFARRLRRRALIVVFTDLIDPTASLSLLKSLNSFADNHLLMVVTLSDSHIQELANQMPATGLEAYRKGVALDLLALRQEALQTLCKTRNAVIVDEPPDKLDEVLLRKYMQLKRRNRI